MIQKLKNEAAYTRDGQQSDRIKRIYLFQAKHKTQL